MTVGKIVNADHAPEIDIRFAAWSGWSGNHVAILTKAYYRES